MKKIRKKLLVFDLDNTLYPCDEQLNGSYERIDSITAFEGISEIMTITGATNILVTHGDPPIQLKKVAVLGIADYFDDIIVELTDKRNILKSLAKKYKDQVDEMFVIGDRIDREIRYGNEFGFTSILMLYGKYSTGTTKLLPKDRFEKPDHTAKNLWEIVSIVSQ